MALLFFCSIFLYLFLLNGRFCVTQSQEENLSTSGPLLIKNLEEYNGLLAKNPNVLLVFHVYRTKTEKHIELGKKITFWLEQATRLIEKLVDSDSETIQIYQINCEETPVPERCFDQMEFNLLFGIKNQRSWEEYFQLNQEGLNEYAVMQEILEMISSEWPNYTSVRHGKGLEDELKKYDQPTDFYLCYGDSIQSIGRSFCFVAGRMLLKEGTPPVYTVNRRSQLTEIAVYTGLGINTHDLLPMLGLWYVDCTSRFVEDLKDCIPYQYRGDHTQENIKNFIQCRSLPPVVKIGSDGSIPDSVVDSGCHRLFYFYESGNQDSIKDEARQNAEKLAQNFKGTLVALTVDLDELPDRTVDSLAQKIDRNNLPALMLKLASRFDKESFTFHWIKDEPESSIDNLLNEHWDLPSLFELTAERDEEAFDIDDPTVQDDEVELLLHALRNESCFHCPIKQKMAHKLDDVSLPKLLQKHTVFTVLFWLNVDTVSRAVLHMIIEASPSLAKSLEDSRLGTVACHDWPDICKKYKVESWPKLVLFSQGKPYKEYKSVWDAYYIVDWITMFERPSLIKLGSIDEIEAFTRGEGLSLTKGKAVHAVTLAVVDNLADDSHVVKVLTAAAKTLHGRYFVGAVAGENAKQWIKKYYPKESVPFILTFKPKDQFEPVRKWTPGSKGTSAQNLVDFIITSSRPTVVKITETSFPVLYRANKPILLLIGTDVAEQNYFATLGILAQDKDINTLVSVAYLEKGHSKNLTHSILSAFGSTTTQGPVLILSDAAHGKGYLFKSDVSHAEAKDIKSWVQKAFSDDPPSHVSLITRDWKTRPLMYDYKGFIYGEDSIRPDEWKEESRKKPEIKQKGSEKIVEGMITQSHATHDEF